jgi:hypothetical protein
MKRILFCLGWLAVGALLTSFATGSTVRQQRAAEATTEVALSGNQAFVHIPTFHVGYETSPASVGLAFLRRVLSPWAVMRATHRVDGQTIIVIDASGIRKMTFEGVSGPFQITPEGPVVRVGNQLCRWNGRALVTLTLDEGLAVQRDYTGPTRPPWRKQGLVFRDPAVLIRFTIDGTPHQLEARATGDVKTLTLVDARGGRRDIWSLDEASRSVSADQFGERFR